MLSGTQPGATALHPSRTKFASTPSSFSQLAVAAALLASASASAANPSVTLYVDKSAPSGGDGSSWQKAYRDIHDAFENLGSKIAGITPPPDCTIKVAQGEYKPDRGTGDRTKQYFLSFSAASATSLSLLGSFGGLPSMNPDNRDPIGTATVISGDLAGDDGPDFANRTDNSHRLLTLYANAAPITIDGFALRGAHDTDPVLLSSIPIPSVGALTLSLSNPASPLSSACAIRMVNCTLEDNFNDYPGGAANISGGQVLVQDCVFRRNTSPHGLSGALRLNPESFAERHVTIQRSHFLSNSSPQGGAVWTSSFCSLERCVFDSNSGDGGAIYSRALWTMSSCLFSRNQGASGAIFSSLAGGFTASANEMKFCTFANNRGYWAGAITHEYANLKSRHCLFWGNSGSPSVVSLYNGNAFFWSTLIQGGTSSIKGSLASITFLDSTLSADPQFINPASDSSDKVPFAQLNYRLRLTSPALSVDSNDNYDRAVRDLDGNLASLVYKHADIGAYFNATRTCLANLTDDPDGAVDDSDFALFSSAYDLMLLPDGANPSADLNRDGVVDDADFQFFVLAYDNGMCP